jgi:hypothetical protein
MAREKLGCRIDALGETLVVVESNNPADPVPVIRFVGALTGVVHHTHDGVSVVNVLQSRREAMEACVKEAMKISRG